MLSMDREQIIDKLTKMAEKLGSQRALAEQLGVSPAYLNDVLQGNRKPGKAILEALKLEAKTKYVAAGQQGSGKEQD